MLSEAELSLDVLLDANREWFEYESFQPLTHGFSEEGQLYASIYSKFS